MPHDDKRKYRKLKRDVKKAGNKKRRQRLKHDLVRDPAEAHHSVERLGRFCSETLNGIDKEQSRKPAADEEE